MEDSKKIKEKNKIIIRNLILLYGFTKELQLKTIQKFDSSENYFLQMENGLINIKNYIIMNKS